MELTRGDRFAYAVGDFGLNVCWFTANTYLLFFYTDVLGLPARQAGLIVLAGLMWDASTDPIMGVLAERTRTKLGRYRPFLFLGALPLGLALTLAFSKPMGSVPALWWALTSHIVLRSVLTVIAVPYASLPTRITSDGNERARLSGWRVVLAMGGAFYASALTLPLVAAFGGAEVNGFAFAAGVGGALATVAVLWCGKRMREPPALREGRAERHLPIREALRSLRANEPFMILLACSLAVAIGNAALAAAALYVFEHVWQAEALTPVGLAAALCGAVVGAPVWTAVVTQHGYRWGWTFGFLAASCGLAPLWFLGPSTAGYAPLFLFVLGFGASSQAVILGAALPNTVDYGEVRTGRRTESLPVALVVFFQKVGTGLGALVVATALDLTGYAPGGAPSSGSLHAMRGAFVLLPLITFGASALLFARYDLTAARQRSVRTTLEERASTESATEVTQR